MEWKMQRSSISNSTGSALGMTLRWLLFGALALAAVGCGGRTDPRTRPGFVDTSNPKDGAKHMKDSSPLANPKKDKASPGSKPGGS
jgi:hypothetical protein